MQPQENVQRVIDKISQLPAGRVSEVEDFVDFLNRRTQDRTLTLAAQSATEPVLDRIWDNTEDAIYDAI